MSGPASIVTGSRDEWRNLRRAIVLQKLTRAHHTRYSKQGFTLIEVALVLAIVGFLSISAMTMVSAQIDAARQRATLDKLAAIKHAVSAFVVKNSRLPCPAQANLTATDANYGVEAAPTPGTPPACTNAETITSDAEGNSAPANLSFRGIVPWKTLGLPEEEAQDGHYRFFTYHVSAGAIFDVDATGAIRTSDTLAAMRGVLTVHTGAPTSLGLPPSGNQINGCSSTKGDNGCNIAASVVFVSHGKDGYGAWAPNGVQISVPGGISATREKANADANNSYVQAEFSSDSNDPYDDVVMALSPAEILEPLARSGSIVDARAQTLERMNRVRDSLVAYAAAHLTMPSPSGTDQVPNAVLGLPSADVVDGWGSALRYASDSTYPDSLKLGAPSNTLAFGIYANGVNRTSDLCTKDDLCLMVTVGVLQGRLVGAGVAIN